MEAWHDTVIQVCILNRTKTGLEERTSLLQASHECKLQNDSPIISMQIIVSDGTPVATYDMLGGQLRYLNPIIHGSE